MEETKRHEILSHTQLEKKNLARSEGNAGWLCYSTSRDNNASYINLLGKLCLANIVLSKNVVIDTMLLRIH